MFDQVVTGAVEHLDPDDPLRRSAVRQRRAVLAPREDPAVREEVTAEGITRGLTRTATRGGAGSRRASRCTEPRARARGSSATTCPLMTSISERPAGQVVEAHRRAGVRDGGRELGHVAQRVVEGELDPLGHAEPVGLRTCSRARPSRTPGSAISSPTVTSNTAHGGAEGHVAEELLPDHQAHVGERPDVEAGLAPRLLDAAGPGPSGRRASRRSGSVASLRGGRAPARGSTTRTPRRSR